MGGHRLQADEALLLIEQGDFLEVGLAADELQRQKHPGGLATFIIDRNINYTNICLSRCRFCAFYRNKGHPEAFVLSKEEIFDKIEETVELEGSQIMLQGGLNPDLTLDYYLDLLRSIKEHYPQISIHSFSPPEIYHFAQLSGLSIAETLRRLAEAGLDSLPGGGAEILVDEVRRKISPNKISADLWLQVMEEAHKLGMGTTATMMMGSLEGRPDRIEHLRRLRDLQDKTGGFRAFIPWTFQPGHTELGDSEQLSAPRQRANGGRVSSLEYLKTLSVARLFLDNFDHIQGSWVTQGPEIGQMSLCFGGDDLGSIMIEENVVRSTGVSYKMSKEEMISLIGATGRIPAKRNTKYEIMETFEVSS